MMGKSEEAARRLRRKGYLQSAVLATVGMTGLILVMAAAPNTLQLLGTTSLGKRFTERALSALTRLSRRGFVVFEEKNGKKYARITEAGKRFLAMEEQRAALLKKKKKRWDRRYRIIMFDIREERKGTRNKLRITMRSWGFLRLQDSVWVYPYDCEDVIALLKADLRIGREVVYVIAESIENDSWIRQHFKLPVA